MNVWRGCATKETILEAYCVIQDVADSSGSCPGTQHEGPRSTYKATPFKALRADEAPALVTSVNKQAPQRAAEPPYAPTLACGGHRAAREATDGAVIT